MSIINKIIEDNNTQARKKFDKHYEAFKSNKKLCVVMQHLDDAEDLLLNTFNYTKKSKLHKSLSNTQEILAKIICN